MVKLYDVEDKNNDWRDGRKRTHNFLEESKYCDAYAVNNVINYIAEEKKTRGHYGGCNCSDDPDEAIDDFLETKELYDKCEGKQLKHFVAPFGSLIKRNKAEEYARQIIDDTFPGYQCFYGVHIKDGRTHIHIAVNSVSFKDGSDLCKTYEAKKNLVDAM